MAFPVEPGRFLLHVTNERPKKLRFYSVPRSWPLDDLLLTQCWCQALSNKYVEIYTPRAFNLYKRDDHLCISSLILLLWPMLPRLIEPYLWYLWLILHLKYVLIVIKLKYLSTFPLLNKSLTPSFIMAYFVRSNVSSQCNSCKKA